MGLTGRRLCWQRERDRQRDTERETSLARGIAIGGVTDRAAERRRGGGVLEQHAVRAPLAQRGRGRESAGATPATMKLAAVALLATIGQARGA